MGYISYVSKMDLNVGELKKPIPIKEWEAIEDEESFRYINYFISACADTDTQKSLGGAEETYVVSLVLDYCESGKAYDFDEHLPAFFKKLNELLVEPVSGSFVLQGEDSGDISLYNVNEDGSVSKSQGIIMFPEVNEVLK